MKNEHKDLYYYQRKYNFQKEMSMVALFGMGVFGIFAIAGWSEYHGSKETSKARLEVIRLGSRKIDSLTAKSEYYQDWYVHHSDDCVDTKVLTDYEINLINKIKKR